MISIDYYENDVYKYVTGGTVFDVLPMERASSDFAQGLMLDKSKGLIDEYSKYMISQYEKIGNAMHDAIEICPVVEAKPIIESAVEWTRDIQKDLLVEYNQIMSREKDLKKLRAYATHHNCILKHLHDLLRTIMRSCEMTKD